MTRRDRDESWELWVKGALRGRHLHRPPAGSLRKAVALGSRLEPRRGGATWLAMLLFDSAAQPAPAGVRGAGVGQRRLLYRATTPPGEEIQLDLRLRREGGTVELTGQLLPPWSGGRIAATSGRSTRKQTLGEAGEFVLKRLPGRSDSLRIEIRNDCGDELVIDDVPLPERAAE